MKHLLVYLTFPAEEEARAAARRLVEKNLAAGVNLVPGARSVYRWRGEIRETRECLAFVQTTTVAFPALLAEIKRAHSYETPCVAAVELAAGDSGFLAWIRNETDSAPE